MKSFLASVGFVVVVSLACGCGGSAGATVSQPAFRGQASVRISWPQHTGMTNTLSGVLTATAPGTAFVTVTYEGMSSGPTQVFVTAS